MNQCGPEWHMLQIQWMSELSDLTILNECSQLLGTAMVGAGVGVFWGVIWRCCAEGRSELKPDLRWLRCV